MSYELDMVQKDHNVLKDLGRTMYSGPFNLLYIA